MRCEINKSIYLKYFIFNEKLKRGYDDYRYHGEQGLCPIRDFLFPRILPRKKMYSTKIKKDKFVSKIIP